MRRKWWLVLAASGVLALGVAAFHAPGFAYGCFILIMLENVLSDSFVLVVHKRFGER